MNTQNVMKMTTIVNYVKPELELIEMEAEGSLLLTASGDFSTGGGGGGEPGGSEGGGGVELRSSKPRITRTKH